MLKHFSKADVDATNYYGWTAFLLTAQNGDVQCLEILTKAKANLESEIEYGSTPLMIAAQNVVRSSDWL